MKTNKILYLLWSILSAMVLFSLASCEDAAVERGDETDSLPYLFRPAVFKATGVGNTTTVELSWAAVNGAVDYSIEIYKDSLEFNPTNLVAEATVADLHYTIELTGSTLYSARIKTNAENPDRDSKWNSTITFKTPSDNMFTGYTSKMIGQGSVLINWLPGANVTRFVFTNQETNSTVEYTISESEKAAGSKICSNLPNATYGIGIYNNTILRGQTIIKVEGDLFLTSGDDLKSAMENAASGNVIVLDTGVYAISSGTFRFTKNIKLRGLNVSNMPVLCMKEGATTTASMFGFEAASSFDYVTFENIDFSGWVENNQATNKIGYLFNNNTATTVGAVTFTNCNIHNIGNTPVRLQGGTGQRIGTVSFNNCIIFDIGNTSVYAVVNINSADFIDNIIFRNSTVYNFKGSLVLRTAQSIASITVENCTINQGMTDTAGNRYLIDVNTSLVGSITLRNNILGQTAANAGGIRPLGDYVISGNYYTSDYTDDALVGAASSTIKPKMTAYGKTSTDLWTTPTAGNFTFKDATFVGKATAGDPRWK